MSKNDKLRKLYSIIKTLKNEDECAAFFSDLCTDKELEKKIRAVDKARAQYYRFYTGEDLNDKLCYDLGVNTSGLRIKPLATAIAALVKSRSEAE